jgi:hypothetical protein
MVDHANTRLSARLRRHSLRHRLNCASWLLIMRTRKPNDEEKIAVDRRIFKWRVTLRDLRTGAVRELPLEEMTRIHLVRKRNEAQRPNESVLRLKDDSTIIEAVSLDDLAAQLRRTYPDETHERTLHRKRDEDAEQRRCQALDDLGRLLAQLAVDKLMNERDEQSLNRRPEE